MVLAIALVAGLAYWHEEDQAHDAVADLAAYTAAIAEGLTGAIGSALPVAKPFRDEILLAASGLERPGRVTVLLVPPGASLPVSSSGGEVALPEVVAALRDGGTTLRLPKERAELLGLPRRIAVVGLSRLVAGAEPWGLAVVATAEGQRDRSRNAKVRVILAVAVAGAPVIILGIAALRRQRRQLELAQALAVMEATRERDERLEKLGKAATMLTLASGVAHELSTPLGVIVGRAEQVQLRAGDDARTERAAQSILEQAERIRQVVRGFLDLARGGAPTLTSAAPDRVLKDAMELVGHRFRKVGVALEARVGETLPPIHCEPRLLEHALINLLLNACDACSHRKGGRVEVELALCNGAVEFAVSDNGGGISARDAARVTEAFFTTKPAGKGTGLGLAIANEIVKTHRGSLSIAPNRPRGTRASLQIPISNGGADARS
jgi:signal transduction histidine kinase